MRQVVPPNSHVRHGLWTQVDPQRTLLGAKICHPSFQIQGTAHVVQEKQLGQASDLLFPHVYLKHKSSIQAHSVPPGSETKVGLLKSTRQDGAVSGPEGSHQHCSQGWKYRDGIRKTALKPRKALKSLLEECPEEKPQGECPCRY